MQRTKYMSEEELWTLVNNTPKDARDRNERLRWLLVNVALQTGLRVNELARITAGDCDLNRGVLHVWRSKKKGGAQRDQLAMSPSLRDHLRSHIEWMKRRFPKGYTPSMSIWPGQRGPMTKRGLQQAWHRACELAGLKSHVPIHGARHTLAVHLLQETGNLRMVQKQLGHSSPTTTANMYADVTFEAQVEALGKVFG